MKKVYWRKGHGGNDPGAVGNGLKEKDLNHRIVQYAVEHMNKTYNGVKQKTSWATDRTVSLTEATNEANAWDADVFVSSHINAGGGTGFETFIFPSAKTDTQNLQSLIHDEVLKSMREFDKDIKDRGKKRKNLHDVRETNMPAVLTEILFIDTNDYKHLKNEAFLKAVGEAYSIAVAKYLNLKKKATVAKSATATYKVQLGDTLSHIAQKHKTSVNKMMQLNPQLKNKNIIYAGNILNVPK